MSICVAFNLSDGVVIAVDSATTLTDASGSITKVFLDADKLFQLGNLRVGIATYGLAAIDGRTIGSFVREFILLPSNSDIDTLSLCDIVERLRTCLKTRQYVARVDVRKQCRSWFRLRHGAIRSLWINVVTS